MADNYFGLLRQTIVNKEKTYFEKACIFLLVRYNISTLIT